MSACRDLTIERYKLTGKEELIKVLKRHGLDLGLVKLGSNEMVIAIQLLQLEELERIKNIMEKQTLLYETELLKNA
tara:strand:+ start:90 stop:317 length:228 start_codon:yes stop_codon:yes gene_type:complete